MKNSYTLTILLVLIFTGVQTMAQEEEYGSMYQSTDFTGFYLGGNASTNGWGFDAK